MFNLAEFSFGEISIAGVALVWLLPRLIEAFKVWGLQGTGRIYAVGFGLGGAFGGLSAALALNLVPVPAQPWIQVFMWVLGGGVAMIGAIGEYELNKKRAIGRLPR